MVWKGFIAESKKYMGYGKAYPKWKFWFRFPFAAIVFYFYLFKDWLGGKINGRK